MSELVRCPGAEHKWIERKDLHSPTRLEFQCECGEIIGWPDCVVHRCDWQPEEPGQRSCDECGRYKNCPCVGGPIHD